MLNDAFTFVNNPRAWPLNHSHEALAHFARFPEIAVTHNGFHQVFVLYRILFNIAVEGILHGFIEGAMERTLGREFSDGSGSLLTSRHLFSLVSYKIHDAILEFLLKVLRN